MASTEDTDPVSTVESKAVEMSDFSEVKSTQSPTPLSSTIASASEPVASSTTSQLHPQENQQSPESSVTLPATETTAVPTPVSNVPTITTSSPPTAAIPAETEPPPQATRTADSITTATDSNNSPSVLASTPPEGQGPVCNITLLLTSGARHPYKLDERYLTKRNVNIPERAENGRKDPFSISVYTLKELILREWRPEWEVQPSSPSSIRLIHFGRLLDDKMPLKECRFNTDSPNVVHMTVRPQEVVDEEDASKGKAMGRDGTGSERTAGCRCVIM